MSWKDDIQTIEYEIITGDGKSWKPLWKNSVRNVNFNTEGFDFVGKDGTYVQRENVQGAQYAIEFYFVGENHIKESYNFDISSYSKNPWTIKHPIYGNIVCQPLSLSYDSNMLSATKVTGTVWETLLKKEPQKINNVRDEVYILRSKIETSFSYTVTPIETTDLTKLDSVVSSVSSAFDKLKATREQITKVKNQIRKVSSAIKEVIQTPIRFIDEYNHLVSFPFEIAADITSKINELERAIDGIIDIRNTSLFQQTTSAIIGVSCDIAINSTSISGYKSSKEVIQVIDKIKSMNSKVLQFYEDNEMIPDPNILQLIDLIVYKTISNLYLEAQDLKQERSIILEKDTSPIMLAHRFYGFSDSSLDRVISENNLQLKDLLFVKKGTKLIWYV